MKPSIQNAEAKNNNLQEEYSRLRTLGVNFKSKYNLQSTDFITEFIPKFLEYYVDSQKRDKYAKPLPLTFITNSPFRNLFTKFDLNLLFPDNIWEFSMSRSFLDEISMINCNSYDLSSILHLIKQILQGDFEFQRGENFELSEYHMYQLKLLDHYLSPFPKSKVYRVFNQFKPDKSVYVQITPKQKFTLNSQNSLENLYYVDSFVFITSEQYQTMCNLNKFLRLQKEDPFIQDDLNLVQEIKINTKQCQIKIGDKQINQIYSYYIPRQFKVLNFQPDQYVFNQNYQRWIRKSSVINFNKREQQQNELKSSFYLLKKYLFTPNFQQYRNLLNNIRSEKFTVNMEQFKAISQEKDTILIGRSGTGKTTISLLKLFITDAIFMLRQNLDLQNESNNKINMQYNHQLQNGVQLKTLFLTSSPLLAQQIKNKYQNLVKTVEESLKEKIKIKKQNEQQKDNLDDSTAEILDILGEEQENESQLEIEEENEEDIDSYEKEMGQYESFQDIKSFPAFLTIRKLLFLIDSQLQNPFFKNKEQINRSAQWHNEYCGVLSLNQNINYNISDKLTSEVNELDSKEIIYHNNKLKEVTSESFKDFFWPKIISEINWNEKQLYNQMDPMLLWSEIINIIKGDETSYQYPNFYISQEAYKQKYRYFNYDIYKLFQIYEQLKSNYGYYDLLDMVNHINYQQVYCIDNIEYIHFIMLDELQDVPKALLSLLKRMTQVQLFLAGDSAQNIVKGIGIKFQDILHFLESENDRNIFAKSVKPSEPKPQLIKLSYNFRSSNQILQLGNTIVSILEILFQNSLDFLQKEKSNQQGPKPTIIQSNKNQDFLNYLYTQYKNKQNNVEFGSNLVIIVKDQESKLKIPIELQNAIILTIYEAKGLEFDDVILFNFFTDVDCTENSWNLIKQLDIVKTMINLDSWNNQSNQYSYLTHKQINKHQVELTKLQLKQYNSDKQQFQNNTNLSLQLELKQLYVAITRPKKRLIIFDQQLQNRIYIQKILEELNLVEIIHETQLQQIQIDKFILSFSIDNKANWKKQGYRMLRLNNYDQAYKCFMFASEINLAKKSLAYNLATQASLTSNNFQLFIQAAIIFEEINLPKRAASCYFSGKNYQKAFEIYQQQNCKNEMAESSYFSGNYQLAGQIFSELGEVRRSIECFNKSNDWISSLNQLHLHKDQFTIHEQLMFLNLIFPQYLKSIIQDIEKEELIEQHMQQAINPNDENESFQVENSIITENSQDQQIIIEANQKLINNDLNNEDSQSFQVIQDDSIDHLTFYDPEDEWIKTDSQSLIKSISSSIAESQYTSVLLMSQPSNIPILKSRTNIFIKNNVMQQLVQIFQKFQYEFKTILENQKSQKAQLSFRDQEEKELDHMINFIYDFENYDLDIVYLILDVLEHFKSYKLCIYICNEIKFSSHLGRYLVSLASQYTPITKNTNKLDNWIIGNNLKRRRLLDQSIIAQIALNNIFQSMNPIYLQFKNYEQLHSFNSFGIGCYKLLIGLGFWKNIIYQLNFDHALNLCESFNNYHDLITLIQKMREKQDKSKLLEEQEYQLIKYNYFIQVEQYFIQNSSKIINVNQLFVQTIECASQRKLSRTNVIQLINNSKLDKENLTNQEKLKQLESIILIMFCCMGILKFESDSYSTIIDFVELQQHCINNLSLIHNKPIIIEALQFLFKFSFPSGEIMTDYSQFCIIHITSRLIKNFKDQMMFIDIAYEYILISFEALGKLIKLYFCNIKPISILLQSIENQNDKNIIKIIFKCLKQRLQYQYENILPNLNQLCDNQKKDYYSKITYGIKQKNLENTVENHETSILHIIKSDEMKAFHKWLLQTNFRVNKMDKQFRYYLKNESIILFQTGVNNLQQKHGYFILALNLLHLQENIPFAIFTLLNNKDQQEQEYYIKYLEFLECQHYDIIEDSLDCFIQFNQYFEDKIYLDEWINHLIRIGIKLLLAQEGIKQIIIPQKYLKILPYQQHLYQPLFQITKVDIFEDYIEQILYFLEICNSEHYEYQGNLLLIIFMMNLQNFTYKIKERLCQTFSNQITFPFYKELHKSLNQKHINIQKDFIDKTDVLFIKGYIEEKVIMQQIHLNTNNCKPEVEYQNCLNKWEGYFLEAQQIKQNGLNLLKKWRQFKLTHKTIKIIKNLSNPLVLRFYQFYKIQLKDILFTLKDTQHKSLVVRVFSFQEELLKLRLYVVRGADLQFINSILNRSINILKEIKNANLQFQLFEELQQIFLNWKNNPNRFEKDEEELLERNRQILRLKWQNISAGVKVQNKFHSQPISTVDEHIDGESQE